MIKSSGLQLIPVQEKEKGTTNVQIADIPKQRLIPSRKKRKPHHQVQALLLGAAAVLLRGHQEALPLGAVAAPAVVVQAAVGKSHNKNKNYSLLNEFCTFA